MLNYILCGIILMLVIVHHFERRDLYNRIMSRDYTEYKGRKIARTISAHERALRRWRGEDGENGT